MNRLLGLCNFERRPIPLIATSSAPIHRSSKDTSVLYILQTICFLFRTVLNWTLSLFYRLSMHNAHSNPLQPPPHLFIHHLYSTNETTLSRCAQTIDHMDKRVINVVRLFIPTSTRRMYRPGSPSTALMMIILEKFVYLWTLEAAAYESKLYPEDLVSRYPPVQRFSLLALHPTSPGACPTRLSHKVDRRPSYTSSSNVF